MVKEEMSYTVTIDKKMTEESINIKVWDVPPVLLEKTRDTLNNLVREANIVNCMDE